MKKRILSVALVVAMLAIVITGGTLAYLTDTEGQLNTLTVGNVTIAQTEDFEQNSKLIPKVDGNDTNVVKKEVSVKNTGSEPAYIRTFVLYEKEAIEDADKTVTTKNSYAFTSDPVVLTFNDDTTKGSVEFLADDVEYDNGIYKVAVYTYAAAIEGNKGAGVSLKTVHLKSDVGNEWFNVVNAGSGAKYDIYVFSQAVQSNGFTSIDAAFEAGFGELTVDNIESWAETALTVNP